MTQSGEGMNEVIASHDTEALTRVAAIEYLRTDNRTLDLTNNLSGLVEKVVLRGADDRARDAKRAVENAMHEGRALALSLRTFGLVLDVLANRTGTTENSEFVPDKTNIAKFLGFTLRERMTQHLLTATGTHEMDLSTSSVYTAIGPRKPSVIVEARTKLEKYGNGPKSEQSPLKYPGPIASKSFGIREFSLETKVDIVDGDQLFQDDRLPQIRVLLGDQGSGYTFLSKGNDDEQPWHSYHHNGYDYYPWNWVGHDRAEHEIEKFDVLTADLLFRPGKSLVEQIRENL